MKQVQYAHEMELLELKAKSGVSIQEPDTIKAKGPKLPAFEEGKDEMDSYLHRPELKTGNRNYGPHT